MPPSWFSELQRPSWRPRQVSHTVRRLGIRMIDFPDQFQASPKRGVVTGKRLAHWHELLEEWCLVHERYCRLVQDDAIFWHPERTNLAALAAAAWRSGWAALEEFPHDKMINGSKRRGRTDLYLKSPASEDYVESKLVWCREGSGRRIARVLAGIDEACTNARALRLGRNADARRIGVVFAIPSRRNSDSRELHGLLAKLINSVHEIGMDAAAWCFPPPGAQRDSDGRDYPGVVLLAKLASSPRRETGTS